MPTAAEKIPSPQARNFLQYARAHQLLALAIGLTLLTAISAFFGSQMLAIPGSGPGGMIGVPMRRELPIAFAALAAGSLNSRMGQFELAAGPNLRVYEIWHVLIAGSVSVALVGGTEFFASGAGLAIVLARACVIWFGLALLSGRIFGRKLSWIIPVATIFPLTYLGQDGEGQARWWDWTGQPPESIPCWAIAMVSTACGMAAFLLTPWHVRAFLPARNGHV
ncbi:hypothetical protein [Kitasatospora sp. NPDC097691]|uniref:hypothetical protein n=1 Tax=Kitasatospora sp. NPDC097691 TaxID=3157231 RepID=UPI00332B5A01